MKGIRIMSKVLSIIYFCLGFIETYLIMSFYIPSLRIGLIAPPLDFFLKSIKTTWVFKTIISTILGLLMIGIYFLLIRKKKDSKIFTLLLVLLFIIILIGSIYESFTANIF